MHFTSFLTIFTLATLSTATIIDGLAPRRTTATTTTTSRAVSAETVCACISGPLSVKKVNVGSLSELCTCISVLSDFVTTTTISTVLRVCVSVATTDRSLHHRQNQLLRG
ncbi:hypothetical protein B0H13DRAFT_336430 [Mycena leptocephala]|nr:hypothetical protein B0H13DRAFT_336430 [Mycena leptocephala]